MNTRVPPELAHAAEAQAAGDATIGFSRNGIAYKRAADVDDALRLAWASHGAERRFLAGGTNLIELMKEQVERPAVLIDIGQLPLDRIEALPDGGLRLGALAANIDTARHPDVAARYPVLAAAILAGASQQLRNAATNGGNLNQRTRCGYFHDPAAPCNKRQPGSGCWAMAAPTRGHAILGASEQCIATHPSDMCVALAVLDARVRLRGPNGEREIPFAEYHRLPGDYPAHDNTLGVDELVTAIDLPPESFPVHHSYLKLRDSQLGAFALVSVAVVLALDPTGRIRKARIALGGVAHKPWRVPAAEQLLIGRMPGATLFDTVADRLLEGAMGRGDSAAKIELARRAIERALTQAVFRQAPVETAQLVGQD